MSGSEPFTQQPVFFVLAVISAILTAGYFLGNYINRKKFEAAYRELLDLFRPEKHESGNIGGSKEYYCNFNLKKGGALERVDAKFTFLPRSLWPYLPIALMIDKHDTLLIALHFRERRRDEAHLIEARYAKTWRAKIEDLEELNKAFVTWGNLEYYIYYRNKKTLERLKEFIAQTGNPGGIRHIALLPDTKNYIFLIPEKGRVAKDLSPVYQWILTLD